MATRDVIEKKINEISDGGNNSAAEMRDVLTDLLDYTENVPSTGSNVEFFHFWDENPITDNNNLSQLWYSFKGINKESVNFTFKFILLEPDPKKGTDFYYKLDDKLLEVLKNILFGTEDDLRFIVPGCYNDFYSNHVCLNISLIENTLRFRFSNNNFDQNNYDNGFNIFTSIQFHCPPFNFGKR